MGPVVSLPGFCLQVVLMFWFGSVLLLSGVFLRVGPCLFWRNGSGSGGTPGSL